MIACLRHPEHDRRVPRLACPIVLTTLGVTSPVPPKRKAPVGRSGFSLLEVILAMAILVGSLAVISQLIDLGAGNAVEARLRTDAILRCESKMQEIVAGVLPAESTSPALFDDDPMWQWSVDVEPGVSAGLLGVTVTVAQTTSQSATPVSYSLHRWLRDPVVLEQMLEDTSSDGSDESGSY